MGNTVTFAKATTGNATNSMMIDLAPVGFFERFVDLFTEGQLVNYTIRCSNGDRESGIGIYHAITDSLERATVTSVYYAVNNFTNSVDPSRLTLTAPSEVFGSAVDGSNQTETVGALQTSLSSTNSGEGASLISIADAGNLYNSTNVEDALQEVMRKSNTASSTATAAQTQASQAYNVTSNLASTSTGMGASLVGINDAGSYLNSTSVEGALQEIASRSLSNASSIAIQASQITSLTSTQSAHTSQIAALESSNSATVTTSELANSSTSGTVGAAMVGTRQNIAGSVGRTQASKNAEFVTLTDFGALPDGVTDASNALASACALNGKITIPFGDFYINNVDGALQLNNFTGEIEFQGGARLLFGNASKPGLIFLGGQKKIIRNMRLGYKNTPTLFVGDACSFQGDTDTLLENYILEQACGAGVSFVNSVRPKITNALITNTNGDGISLNSCTDAELTNITVNTAKGDGIKIFNTSSDASIKGVIASNLKITSVTGYGLAIKGQSDVIISAAIIDTTGNSGFYVGKDNALGTQTPDNVNITNSGVRSAGQAVGGTGAKAGFEYGVAGSVRLNGFVSLGSAGDGVYGNGAQALVMDDVGISTAGGKGINVSAGAIFIDGARSNNSQGKGIVISNSSTVVAKSMAVLDACLNDPSKQAFYFDSNSNILVDGIDIVDDQATATSYLVTCNGNSQQGVINSINYRILNGTFQFQQGSSTGVTEGLINGTIPNVGQLAPLASPSFTGVPTAPTAAAGTNTAQVATCNFVRTEVANATTGTNPSFTGNTTFTGSIEVTDNVAAGTYGIQVLGSTGAARDLLNAGQSGYSNGLSVQYNGTNMVYTFLDGTTTHRHDIAGSIFTAIELGNLAATSSGTGSALNFRGYSSTITDHSVAAIQAQHYGSANAADNGQVADLVTLVADTNAPSNLVETARFSQNYTRTLNQAYVHAHTGFGVTPVVSLAIGDSDTGFNWSSDGVIQIYANNTNIGSWNSSGLNITGTLQQNGNNVWTSGNLTPSNYAPLASPALTGTPTAPTAGAGTNNTQVATTAFVQATVGNLNLSQYAPLASPALTGAPTAPTQANTDNSTKLATTAYVQSALSSVTAGSTTQSAVTYSSSATMSASITSQLAICDATSGSFTLNLPAANSHAGTYIAFVRKDNTANTVTIARSGTDTIDSAGVTSFNLPNQGSAYVIMSDGTSIWRTVDTNVSPHFSGSPLAPTPATADNSTAIATTAYVQSNLSSYAPLVSPALTGNPTAPTQASTDSSTKLATTAFVKSLGYLTSNQSISLSGDATGSGSTSIAVSLANTGVTAGTYQGITVDSKGRVTGASAQNYAGLSSPAFSGTPTAPTASAGTNNTQIATTAFVQSAVASSGNANPNFTSVLIGGTNAGSSGTTKIYAGASPSSSMNTYGTDNSGWGYSIAKNYNGTITTQFFLKDNGNLSIGNGAADLGYTLGVAGTGYFSGALYAPTASRGTNNTQVATTAYVRANATLRRVGAYSYASSVTFDANSYDFFEMTLSGNVTINMTTSGEWDGQAVTIRLTQDASGGRTLSWGSGVGLGSDLTSTQLSTGSNKVDYIGLVYCANSGLWHVVSFLRGY